MDKYIKQLGESAIYIIKTVRDFAEMYDLLDSQAYLDFLDELNELSIDQDRK